MLPCAVSIQPAEELAKHMVLPRQQRERLAGVLPLAVPQDLLEECDDALIAFLALFAQFRNRGS